MFLDERFEISAELLRLVLPMINRYGPSYSPQSYAIWYEYVRGANLVLKQELDEILRVNPNISREQTQELYRRHIADQAEQALGRTRLELAEIVTRLNTKLADAGEDASAFASNLATFGRSLKQSCSVEELHDSVLAVSAQTVRIETTMSIMQKELIDSQAAVQMLTEELKKVREESSIDALSQLKNRRAYDLALSAMLDRAKHSIEPMSMILFDIDCFKKINDTYGHVFGDQVIRMIAQIIKVNAKTQDFVARYGGEEFVVLMPAADLSDAIYTANRVRQLVTQIRIKNLETGQSVGAISVSAGAAQYAVADTPETLVSRADRGLYKAKQSGRNRVCAEVAEIL